MSEKKADFYEQMGVAMTCRSFEEYVRMFACDAEELLSGKVLDAAAGASSFGAGARRRGIRVVSADPLYELSVDEMEAHGRAELEIAASKVSGLTHKFDWSYYGSQEEHTRKREESLKLFLEDYHALSATDAYVSASLPKLPFGDGTFTHVFCSHFLFLYAEQFSYEFHRDALLELARVCRTGGTVRIYPLLDLKWRPYPDLERLMEEMREKGLVPELVESKLPFIPGSDKLLRITKLNRKMFAPYPEQ